MNEKQTEEESLARGCAKRDISAMERLYKEYAAMVFSVCRRYMDNNEDAQDAVHDIMLKVYDKIGGFKYSGPGSLGGWIRRISVNQMLDIIRSRRKSLKTALLENDDYPESPDEEHIDIPFEELYKIIQSLPAAKRTVFNLYCIEGVNHARIGKALGITENTSSSLLSKAKHELASKLNNYLKMKG